MYVTLATLRDCLQAVVYATAILAAIGSLWQYRRNSRRERTRWLFDLYQRFWEQKTLRGMRIRVDVGDTGFVKEDKDLDLLGELDDYLNFFEFIAFLWKRRELKLEEVRALFEYPLQTIARDEAVLGYVRRYSYDELAGLLTELRYDLQPDKLFVYGTLRRGFDPHEYLRSFARFVGRGRIAGRLYDLGEYPGAIPSELPGEEVEGELYELGDLGRQLKTLDDYEEFDPKHPEKSLFIRQQVDVSLEGGERLKAWAYLLPRKPLDARRITSGDYLELRDPHRAHRQPVEGE